MFNLIKNYIIQNGGRSGPEDSATSWQAGTIKYGNDGNLWVVKEFAKAQRWVKYKFLLNAKCNHAITYIELDYFSIQKCNF